MHLRFNFQVCRADRSYQVSCTKYCKQASRVTIVATEVILPNPQPSV